MGPISYTQFKVIAKNTEIQGDEKVELVAGKNSNGLSCCRPNGEKRDFSTPQAQEESQFVRSQLMKAVRKQLGKVPDSTDLLNKIETELLGPEAKNDKTKVISTPLDKRTLTDVVQSVETAKANARKGTADNGGSKNVETKPQSGEQPKMSTMELLEAEYEAKEKAQAEQQKSNEVNKAENAPAIEEFKAVVNPKPLTLKDIAQVALGTVAGAPDDKLCMGVANGFAVRFLAPGSEPQGEGKVSKRLYQVDKDAINAATKNLKEALLGLAAGLSNEKQDQVKALLATKPDPNGIESLSRQAVADAIKIIAGELKGTEGELDLDELQAAQDTGDVSLDAVLLSKDENCHKVHAWFDARHQADVAFMTEKGGVSREKGDKKAYFFKVYHETKANPPSEELLKLLDKEFGVIQSTNATQLNGVSTRPCTKNPFNLLEPAAGESFTSSKALQVVIKLTGGPVCIDIAADTTNNGGYIAGSGQEEGTYSDQGSALVSYLTARGGIVAAKAANGSDVFHYTKNDAGDRNYWAAGGFVINSEQLSTDMKLNENGEEQEINLLFNSMPTFNNSANEDVGGGASWMRLNLARLKGSDNFTKAEKDNSEQFFHKAFKATKLVKGDPKWGFGEEVKGLKKCGEMLMIAQFLGDPSVVDPLAANADEQVAKLVKIMNKGDYKALLKKAIDNYKATIRETMTKWIKMMVASGAKGFVGTGMGCGWFLNPSKTVAKTFAKLYIELAGDIPLFYPEFDTEKKNVKLANTWKTAFAEAWEEHLDAQVHKITSQEKDLLKEIASVARGDKEGSGGAGYMGIVNGRVSKFLTKWSERWSGLDNLTAAEKASVNEATDSLRTQLEGLAKKINTKLGRTVAQILKPTGQAKDGLKPPITREAVALAMTEIMKYADDGYGKLDWKKVEKAKSLERSSVQDVFIASGLKTDYALDELGAKTPIKDPETSTRLNRRAFNEKVKKNCKGKIPLETFVYAINQFSVQAYLLKVGNDALKNRYLEVLGKLKSDIADRAALKRHSTASSIERDLSSTISEFKNAREHVLRGLLEEMERIFGEIRNLYYNADVPGTRENTVL